MNFCTQCLKSHSPILIQNKDAAVNLLNLFLIFFLLIIIFYNFINFNAIIIDGKVKMIMLFTLASYLQSMGCRQIGTRTTCGSNKCFLNYCARSICAIRQTYPVQMDHNLFGNVHVFPIQTRYK